MTSALNDHSLDQIFRSARTPNGWADRPVEDDTVRQIFDLLKWGPTSANKPKILKAPVTVIIGHDLDFAGWLFYATGGVAVLGAKTNLTGVLGLNPCVTISIINGNPGFLTCNGTNKRLGGTLGAGVEYGLTPNWSAKVEYLYTAAAALERSHINEVRVGVNYRFGGL
ncbi:MAG TPA: outer membrane beta-barrel protein [Methylocella sp.]|jgi:opacity protein-like surface antigen